jgi:hypothetical protein
MASICRRRGSLRRRAGRRGGGGSRRRFLGGAPSFRWSRRVRAVRTRRRGGSLSSIATRNRQQQHHTSTPPRYPVASLHPSMTSSRMDLAGSCPQLSVPVGSSHRRWSTPSSRDSCSNAATNQRLTEWDGEIAQRQSHFSFLNSSQCNSFLSFYLSLRSLFYISACLESSVHDQVRRAPNEFTNS